MGNDIYAALREGFTDPIRDVLWGHIYLTPQLAALTKSAPFMRLFRIFQLGPAYGTYPGATHTRAAHSIGVYHLARRLLLNLAERGADRWLSFTGGRSFLCAALLHDLGHFPYAHSLKELPLASHEELTGKIILSEPVKSLVADAGGDPYFTAAVVDVALPAHKNQELVFYRKLLSGALDPDKLDYLNRDARYCGVPYGAQDVDFIFSRLHPQPERGFDIDSRGIPSVESILFSKYLMYRSVYWHRSVRSATAMIKKALLAGLNAGAIAREELYNLDDQGLFTLMAGRPVPLFSLAEKVRDGYLYGSAAEFPFDESIHRSLLDIERRYYHEQALAREFSELIGRPVPPEELIIDLPEPISFETGLYVRDEGHYFSESSSVFKTQGGDGFIKTLRIIRIFVAPGYENDIKSAGGLFDILHKKKKWLQL
ncbi:HD domain-containing protein [Treponema sp. TIM-1]|uniref:HD domain-containing protein n=1 Tax=Treponema sp. TIM-1 TaxID=2898417 RepID=UPI0039818755